MKKKRKKHSNRIKKNGIPYLNVIFCDGVEQMQQFFNRYPRNYFINNKNKRRLISLKYALFYRRMIKYANHERENGEQEKIFFSKGKKVIM